MTKVAAKKVFIFLRILFLSLILALLLTESDNREPILRYHRGVYSCVGIKSDTNVFDWDNVTFAVHHGRADNARWTHMNYVPFVELYFEANESELLSANRVLLLRTEDNYKNEKYWCDCRRKRAATEDPTKWQTFTVPRELFTKDTGWFKFYITAPRAPEMPGTTHSIQLYYEKIGHDRIKFSLSED